MYQMTENIANYIAECKNNAIIEFLKNNGYRPKKTKRYIYDLNRRLERKGLRLVCEDLNYKIYEDFANTGIFPDIVRGDFIIKMEKISNNEYKKYIEVEDWYDLYENNKFGFNPGVTILIGKNGSGKSTLVSELKDCLDEEKTPCFIYRNEDYEGKSRDSYVYHGQFEMLAQSMMNSEGQEIAFNFGNHVGRIGDFIRKCVKEKKKEAFVILDGIDSGLSIDGINEITSVFDLILEDSKNMDVYILVTANTYELVRNRNCLYVSTGKYINFNNYEDYRRFILNGKKR